MVKFGNSITAIDMPFMGAFGTIFISFLLYLISFNSPYWLVSYSDVYKPFIRMGLWSVCFNDYIHEKDYKINRFSGCFWIFDQVFYSKGFWEYINPRWLIAVQVLISLGFIFQCVAIICIVLYFLLYGNPIIESTIALFSQTASVVSMSLSLITFAIKSEDREWMPRPDHNFLGFSFGFGCLSVFYGLLSIFFLILVFYGDAFFKFKHDIDQIYEIENKSRLTYGARSGQYKSPASYYVGSGPSKQVLLVTSDSRPQSYIFHNQ